MSALAILTKCPLAKCPLAKCRLAKCPDTLAARPGKSPACEPDPGELGHVSPSACTCTEHATRCCSLYRQTIE